jgi:hypothetical protein
VPSVIVFMYKTGSGTPCGLMPNSQCTCLLKVISQLHFSFMYIEDICFIYSFIFMECVCFSFYLFVLVLSENVLCFVIIFITHVTENYITSVETSDINKVQLD